MHDQMAKAAVVDRFVSEADLLVGKIGTDRQKLAMKNVVTGRDELRGFHDAGTSNEFAPGDRGWATSSVIVGDDL